MTKEKFTEILKEYGCDDPSTIEMLWDTKPSDDLDEQTLREAIEIMLCYWYLSAMVF